MNCLLKLFAVDRSNVTLPPVAKSEYVSLNVVELIYPLAPMFPVKLIVVPSNVKLGSA